MKRLAIIPARSGSKGLKDKNIIELCGKPLIAYSIEAAVNTNLFDRVIVSTDSEIYAKISRQYGAEVLMRGEELSNDNSTTYMVLEDILKNKILDTYDYFVLLQPTSPMRNAQHIIEAVEKFEQKFKRFDFLVSMKESEHAKVLVNPIDEDESLKFFDINFSNYRRQGYKDYSPNGARSLSYIMQAKDSVDIDGPIDLLLAKILMSQI